MQLVTIYTTGELLGTVKAIRAKLIKHGRQEYAQYPNAPFVHFIEQGKRKTRGIIKTFKPYLLIVAGHDAPEPEEMLLPAEASKVEGVTIRRARYSSFDPRWEYDANKILNKWLEENPTRLIADYRHSDATEPAEAVATAAAS